MRVRPLIGITCDLLNSLDTRGGRSESFTCPVAYAWSVAQAGGHAILLPHASAFEASLVESLDGVIITGGAFDVPPNFYNEMPHEKLGPINWKRSEFERSLCLLSLDIGLPLLGICGGMQLLNVVAGGSLYQDLSLRPHSNPHEQKWPKHLPQHSVSLVQNTKLAHALKAHRIEVNSTHHQGIARIGHKLQVTAQASDGLVEAIEHESHPFAMGVQWHPEAMSSWESFAPTPSKAPAPGPSHALALYIAFVESARAYRAKRKVR